MAKDKQPFEVKIWPKLYDGTKSESTYPIKITSFSELPDKSKFWKMEILQRKLVSLKILSSLMFQ